MNDVARRVQTTYLVLLLLHTLAASFIWGINTLFLLDAGLSNTEAFAANAFFTAGMVIFEVPTGVLADTRGRRTSYLWGTITLAFATLLYVVLWRVKAPLAAWAVASALLGLGFTFFSGAVEAWLVDALTFSGYTKQGGRLEDVFARGEIVEGIAMLLAVIGLAPAFWVVITLLSLWALMFAAVTPVRQSYLNTLIESKQRATVLSFDSLLESSGAAVTQPLLGKAADVWGYPTSYVASAGIQALAISFCWLAQREHMPADAMLAEGQEV